MPRCASCQHDNPVGARFSSACGEALPDAAGEARDERKIVTVVFVDLVGFTARAERLDPEDVRGLK